MKLYEATNGYVGGSYVRCYIIAETEVKAIDIAKEKFKKEAEKKKVNEMYYKNIAVELMCEDTSKEFVSEIDC